MIFLLAIVMVIFFTNLVSSQMSYSNPNLPKINVPTTTGSVVNIQNINTSLNGSFWGVGTNQNVGAGTKTGSYNINTTGNITSGNSTHFSRMEKGTITNVNIANRETSTQNIGNTLTHNVNIADGGIGGFNDAGISNIVTNNVNYTGNTMSPIAVNTKGISNGIYVQGSHSVNGEELSLSEENSGTSNTVFRTGTQSGYNYFINNYGISNTVAGQTKTTTGAVVTENNYGGHFTATASLPNNAEGSLTKNNYGFYGAAIGTTQNQVSTCYGAYVSSSGCDTNWGYYSATNSPNYFGGNVTVVQDIEGRRNLNITGNSTLTGNNRIGSRNENSHSINNVISENSMLFTAFVYNRLNTGAYGINNNIAFQQNITQATNSYGIYNIITSSGINNRSTLPSRAKSTFGIYNSVTDNMILNGSNARAEMTGISNVLVDGSTKINFTSILYIAHQNTIYNALGTVGSTSKYGTYNTISGTADFNHGMYNSISDADINYGVYNYVTSPTNGTQYGVYNLLTTATNGTQYGVYNNIVGGAGSVNWAIYNANGSSFLGQDNAKTYFGTSLSSSINYNGTDLLINPKETGSGKVYIQGDLAQTTGNSTINMIYGEMWNKSDTGFATIDLVTADVYYPVVNLTCDDINGFSCIAQSGNLTTQVAGMYQITAKIGAAATSLGGEYGMKMFINDVGQSDCYDHERPSTAPIVFIITCIKRLNVGDVVNVKFDDHASPVRDLTLLNANVNLIRIGN